jgi:hypothetical protein
MKYNQFEKDIIQEFENDEWKSVEDIDDIKEAVRSAVQFTIKNKNK